MKRITTLLSAMLLFGFLQAQEMDANAMKAWQDYMTPGDVHKMLASFDGEWNEDITMWMDPKAPPQKSTSTCTNKMILGGRYQESKHTGNMMGMPFEGIGTLAWDNSKKMFVSTWVDNMGTGIMYMEGNWDANKKTMELRGKQTDPTTGKDMKVREVMKIVDDKTQMMEMYMEAGGKEYKSMEIKFTRK
jgi:Protein of unknown function (DUF1579)